MVQTYLSNDGYHIKIDSISKDLLQKTIEDLTEFLDDWFDDSDLGDGFVVIKF